MRGFRHGLTVCGVVFATLALMTMPAWADPPIIDWEDDDDGVDIIGTDPGDSSGSGPSNPIITVPMPWTESYFVPACSGNSVSVDADGNTITLQDALCTQFFSCPVEGQHQWYVYQRPRGADGSVDGPWQHSGSVCRETPSGPEGGPVEITEADIIERARELVPTPVVNIEPAPRTYVNVPTNVSTGAQPDVRDVEILGVAVQVEFAPTTATWDFGDGATDTGHGIHRARVGEPGAIEHVYRRGGTYGVTVTQSYELTIRVAGAPPVTLGTPLTTTSEPFVLQVGEIQTRVVGVR